MDLHLFKYIRFMIPLPNHTNAVVTIEKLTDYCMNELHPSGKDKAVVFKSALGIGKEDAHLLRDAILSGLSSNECKPSTVDEFGARFSVRMKVRIFDREAEIVTAWIIRFEEGFPRLTSCYVKN